ncbi:hypothetical protein FT663_03619 [Candidozyma haemuli var. vulneris]|uniref:GATA-type domain-containing protein n=1 Tax=Candidozyma haemuli TaxID=45357 RepID=A0A2V1AXF7_9ASCO|nr:hypothetical protein CXQ85_005043 [[Candida] haemuloni]KAF3989172.1 hypothetical protein FT662_02988 [[Candida] haemuloni var. vulneris]KAF3989422.1 hypothetical protein FT663_03619 [[Candida] haemuloni var. vulneris]PVH22474.1 hypothetical protein CXQ85_005043 [[Candida] haemuloni]
MLYYSSWEIGSYNNFPTMQNAVMESPRSHPTKLPSVQEMLQRIQDYDSGNTSSLNILPPIQSYSPASINSSLSQSSYSTTSTTTANSTLSKLSNSTTATPPAEHSATPKLTEVTSMPKPRAALPTPTPSPLSKKPIVASVSPKLSKPQKYTKKSLLSSPQKEKTIVKSTVAKRRGRKKKPEAYCHQCGSTSTPEWRRGPSGSRSLCNACGLFYMKLQRKFSDDQAKTIFIYKKKTDTVVDRVLPNTIELTRMCTTVQQSNWQ